MNNDICSFANNAIKKYLVVTIPIQHMTGLFIHLSDPAVLGLFAMIKYLCVFLIV